MCSNLNHVYAMLIPNINIHSHSCSDFSGFQYQYLSAMFIFPISFLYTYEPCGIIYIFWQRNRVRIRSSQIQTSLDMILNRLLQRLLSTASFSALLILNAPTSLTKSKVVISNVLFMSFTIVQNVHILKCYLH